MCVFCRQRAGISAPAPCVMTQRATVYCLSMRKHLVLSKDFILEHDGAGRSRPTGGNFVKHVAPALLLLWVAFAHEKNDPRLRRSVYCEQQKSFRRFCERNAGQTGSREETQKIDQENGRDVLDLLSCALSDFVGVKMVIGLKPTWHLKAFSI